MAKQEKHTGKAEDRRFFRGTLRVLVWSVRRMADYSLLTKMTERNWTLAIVIHKGFRGLNVQYLSLLCQSAMPTPVIENPAHRKWTDVGE